MHFEPPSLPSSRPDYKTRIRSQAAEEKEMAIKEEEILKEEEEEEEQLQQNKVELDKEIEERRATRLMRKARARLAGAMPSIAFANLRIPV